MTPSKKKLQPASPKNMEIHPRRLPIELNVTATMAEAEAVGVVDAEDAEDAVEMVDTEKAVEPETATKVSAPIANLSAILQIHAGCGNAPRREETTEQMTSAFAPSVGSQVMLKLIASPTNV